MEYKAFIGKTLAEASAIALGYFGNVIGQSKPDDNNQVLTEADLAIGKAIIKRIQEAYPDHNIIDEEAGAIDKKSEFTWIIDPIDGTSNFANGVVTYGIIVGLLQNDQPIAGGFALPAFSEVYTAEKGKGAFLNNQKITINNTDRKLLSELVAWGIDARHESPEMTQKECNQLAGIVLGIRNLRANGSIFDTAMVVKSKFGAQAVLRGKVWDVAGLDIVITESQGICTDYYGKAIDYTNPLTKINKEYTWCVASPALHKELQHIINPVK